MPTPSKLNLKTTPLEKEEREWRRAERAARKAQKAAGEGTSASHSASSSSRRRFRHHSRERRSESPPRPRHHHLDPTENDSTPLQEEQTYAAMRAEIEEAHFRSKLFDAIGDDSRLDEIEASLNSHVHIPDRWASPSSSSTFHPTSVDSRIEEEEYAEWVRKGMWRRTHRAEVEAQEQAELERTRRKEREKVARRAVQKEEREREEQRARKREEEEKKRREEAWGSYRALWNVLITTAARASASGLNNEQEYGAKRPPLTFMALPWPTYPPPSVPSSLTKQNISSFLLSPSHSIDKTRKQRLREALLDYHPDRFVGRYLELVENSQRRLVEEGVGNVVRALNALLEETTSMH